MIAFKSNDINLYFRVSGKGNPVFFLHGFLEDHSMWDTLYPHIEELGLKTYCFDLPCHGLSRFYDRQCSMEQVAQLLFDFIQEKKLSNVTVIGHSMGGYIGLELAKLIPIDLILLHSNFWEDSNQKKKDRNRVIEIVKTNKNKLLLEAIPNLFAPTNKEKCYKTIDHLIKKASKIPQQEIIATTIGLRDRKGNHAILEKIPVTVIHGEFDPIIPTKKLIDELSTINRKTPLHIIKNAGHMSIWEQPHQLINLLKMILIK
ncbi:alpha/beta fold hydrolase [Crocinitomix algicola]|uniref:alpha/beta fold hydrolase n=1 Tax=Crocinitomix algicola TaxID=1740263 RepID=UPI00082AC480|nr:alpha/beta hydrolase [Crocinitomix algicola]